MKRFAGPLVALVVVVAIVTGSVVLASGDGPFAYEVDGVEFSQSEFDQQLELLHRYPVLLTGDPNTAFPLAGSLPGELSRTWLQLRIQATIARNALPGLEERVVEADRNAVGYPDDGQYADVPERLQRLIVGDRAALNVFQRAVGGDVEPTDAEIAAQLAEACPSNRYVSHVLVTSETVASAIKSDLENGAAFDQLATANSIDTGSVEDGGRVGCVDATEFVEPFQTFARTLPVGVVSDPVETEFGWHVIVVRANDPTTAEIEDAQVAVQQAAQVVTGEAIAEILKKVTVEIDPRYGRWDAATARVLPPKVRTG